MLATTGSRLLTKEGEKGLVWGVGEKSSTPLPNYLLDLVDFVGLRSVQTPLAEEIETVVFTNSFAKERGEPL
jgi:hypothetical protein